MNRFLLAISAVFVTASFANGAAISTGEHYVASSRNLNVRAAPNTNGKISNFLKPRQKVEVLELKDGWARISRYYDGEVAGLSGNVAHWVFARFLSANRPVAAEAVTQDSPVTTAIKSSDDFSKHRMVFVATSEKLVRAGKCSVADFTDMGGWWRSSYHKPKSVYFTYCGGTREKNRVYLDAATGRAFK